MKKLFNCSLVFIFISSCTMTGDVISLSDGSYKLSNQAGFGDGIPKLKNKVYAEGKKFCGAMNKDLVVIEDNTIGMPPSVEIHFNCE
jgi:hypothetical protein